MITIPYFQSCQWLLDGPTSWIFKSLILLLFVLIAERIVRSAALAHRVWLIAIPPKPPETRIRFPATVHPKINQRNVRILLDPSLLSDD